jgi:hypothetical protein
MSINPGDVLEVKFACWMIGQLGLNIKRYIVSNVVGTLVTVGDVADKLATEIGPTMGDLLVDDAVFLGCSCRNLTAVGPEAAVASTVAEVPGTVVSDPMPSQTAGLLTLRTLFAGRANRGRMYIPFPGVDSGNPTDDRPGDPYMATLEILGGKMIATYTVTVGLSNIDVTAGLGGPGIGFVVFNGYTARRAWATQRRRGNLGAANPREIPL